MKLKKWLLLWTSRVRDWIGPHRARILCGYFAECGMLKKIAEWGKIFCGMEKCGKVILQLTRCQTSLGITVSVLSWIESFVTGRTQAVYVARDRSKISAVICGVPQGSVLGPLLFLLYTADVLKIVQNHELMGHLYADDTSIYLHTDATLYSAQLPIISACVDDINKWMSSNCLKLNADKTQFIWLDTPLQLMKVKCRTITLTDAVIQVSDRVTCLGVVIDSQLTFADNVKKLAGSCFGQLRALRRSLTTYAARTLVHALISSRVDYCNSVLYGMCEVYLRPLQSVLNAAARLITGKRKFDRITSTIRDHLHWLPVRQRIVFKLCSIVSKCLCRTAPSYLADLCTPVSATTARTRLRSSSRGDLIIPRSRLTLRIMQFRCLWSCSLELSVSSRSRLIFISILFLPPSENRTV